MELFKSVEKCLLESSPAKKCALLEELCTTYKSATVRLDRYSPFDAVVSPGRPLKPELVDPLDVQRRNMNTVEGRLVLVHAIAHIEFNAINLALDAIHRFRDLPLAYYDDWLCVASEEAHHFTLLNNYLASRSLEYGSYNAHNGLWEMAMKTSHNVLERMALVPRVLEARGLDVTPSMINKLEGRGEKELVEILKIIHREEIGHVAVGTRWFNFVCARQNVDAESTFISLLNTHMKGRMKKPIDEESRKKAGFTSREMASIHAMLS